MSEFGAKTRYCVVFGSDSSGSVSRWELIGSSHHVPITWAASKPFKNNHRTALIEIRSNPNSEKDRFHSKEGSNRTKFNSLDFDLTGDFQKQKLRYDISNLANFLWIKISFKSKLTIIYLTVLNHFVDLRFVGQFLPFNVEQNGGVDSKSVLHDGVSLALPFAAAYQKRVFYEVTSLIGCSIV